MENKKYDYFSKIHNIRYLRDMDLIFLFKCSAYNSIFMKSKILAILVTWPPLTEKTCVFYGFFLRFSLYIIQKFRCAYNTPREIVYPANSPKRYQITSIKALPKNFTKALPKNFDTKEKVHVHVQSACERFAWNKSNSGKK